MGFLQGICCDILLPADSVKTFPTHRLTQLLRIFKKVSSNEFTAEAQRAEITLI